MGVVVRPLLFAGISELNNSISERARRWIQYGIKPIPIPFKQKAPTINGWQKLELAETDISKYFNDEPLNIGVLLGTPSGGLVDIDLDSIEAVAIAPTYFPQTASFGRRSKPRSHMLYRCPDITH